MAEAKAKLKFGTGGCQHVTAEITIGSETRKYVATRDELTAEKASDDQFKTALENLKTNYRLQSDKTDATAKKAIEEATFKI